MRPPRLRVVRRARAPNSTAIQMTPDVHRKLPEGSRASASAGGRGHLAPPAATWPAQLHPSPCVAVAACPGLVRGGVERQRMLQCEDSMPAWCGSRTCVRSCGQHAAQHRWLVHSWSRCHSWRTTHDVLPVETHINGTLSTGYRCRRHGSGWGWVPPPQAHAAVIPRRRKQCWVGGVPPHAVDI